jgi:hypothetical protein
MHHYVLAKVYPDSRAYLQVVLLIEHWVDAIPVIFIIDLAQLSALTHGKEMLSVARKNAVYRVAHIL